MLMRRDTNASSEARAVSVSVTVSVSVSVSVLIFYPCPCLCPSPYLRLRFRHCHCLCLRRRLRVTSVYQRRLHSVQFVVARQLTCHSRHSFSPSRSCSLRDLSAIFFPTVCVWKVPNGKRLSLIVPYRGLCLEENRLPHAPQFASGKDTHTPCAPLDAHTFGTYASLVATLGLRKTRMMDVLPRCFGSSRVEISETDRRCWQEQSTQNVLQTMSGSNHTSIMYSGMPASPNTHSA